MPDRLAAAFDRQDYLEVVRLLQSIPPEDPWARLYQGRLWEVDHQLAAAEANYRQLLRTDCGPKITLLARQGLQRLQDLNQAQQQQAIATATAVPEDTELGVLILEPLHPAAKAQVAPQFAQIMGTDAYTARMLIPSRGWRLYRTGPVGELQVYGKQLQAAGIPVFWRSLALSAQIQVLQVRYVESAAAQITVICETKANQSIAFSFAAPEVRQQVKGLLPIFEQVVDLDARGKLQRKSKTQDYAQICDLHLPQRNCLLRIYDSGYQFQQGINLAPLGSHLDQRTSWTNWQHLTQFIAQKLPQAQIWQDFQAFAETAIDQPDLLNQVDPQINLFRRAASHWDPAFHLYSCLIFSQA